MSDMTNDNAAINDSLNPEPLSDDVLDQVDGGAGFITSTCKVCGGNIVCARRDRKGKCILVKCASCGLISTNL